MSIKIRGRFWKKDGIWILEIPSLDMISFAESLPKGFQALSTRFYISVKPKKVFCNFHVEDGGIFLITCSDPQALVDLINLRLAERQRS